MSNFPAALVASGRWTTVQARQAFNQGLELLFPPACLFCGTELEEGSAILLCVPCISSFTPPAHHCCPRCGTILAAIGAQCLACQQRQFRFDALIALGDYRGDLRAAVLRAKRPTGETLAIALARLLWQEHQQCLQSWQLDAVVPMPMHWSRRLVRGTNSPDLLSAELAPRLAVSRAPLLRRSRRTRPQGSLSATRRAVNVRNAFRLEHPEDFRDARVLLVDDVVTSGASSNEASRLLKRAGAQFVAVAAIARTQPPR